MFGHQNQKIILLYRRYTSSHCHIPSYSNIIKRTFFRGYNLGIKSIDKATNQGCLIRNKNIENNIICSINTFGMINFKRLYTTEKGEVKKLEIILPDPTILLNEVADRYKNLARIILEYVDNSIDDAEGMFRSNENRYPRDINIDVFLDQKSRTVIIEDNCTGMTPEKMERLLTSIGFSSKKGCPWLNGRFGFGVHSFRAACTVLEVTSKTEENPAYIMTINRNRFDNIEPPMRLKDDSEPFYSSSGTRIVLRDVKSKYFLSDITKSLHGQIEYHFETMLSRPCLTVRVREFKSNRRVSGVTFDKICLPYNYETIEGKLFEKETFINGKKISLYIKIADKGISPSKPRIFCKGRRIDDVVNLQSFMDKSKYGTAIWGHPSVMGIIDVADILDPVITRDEFKDTETRSRVYNWMLELEPEIKKVIDDGLGKYRLINMQYQSQFWTKILNRVLIMDSSGKLKKRTYQIGESYRSSIKTDDDIENVNVNNTKRINSKEDDNNEERLNILEKTSIKSMEKIIEGENEKKLVKHNSNDDSNNDEMKTKKPNANSFFNITFVDGNAAPGTQLPRSALVNDTIYIYTNHPDYISRDSDIIIGSEGIEDCEIKGSASFIANQAIRKERLQSYIGNLIAIHVSRETKVKDIPEDQAEIVDDMFDNFMNFNNFIEASCHNKKIK